MTLGPLEYTVVGFQGNRFDGSIADEIGRVVDSGIIRIVDAVIVAKDRAGETMTLEIDDKADPQFARFLPLLRDRMALFTPEDVAELADGLPPDTSGLAILFEHRWAERIKAAMERAGGIVVTRTVVPPEVLEEVSREIEAESKAEPARP